jgi:DNA-binding IclR family transcriptional regulator
MKVKSATAHKAGGSDSFTSLAAKSLSGSQTLVRGLEVLEAVAAGTTNLVALAETLGLNRSTAHRLAATLVEYRYLSFVPRVGYALGPKLLELGYRARQQTSLTRLARQHLDALATSTGDTVHLGVIEGMRALYLDKIPGSRRVEVSSRIGERQPLRSTGLGKALVLDETEDRLRELYEYETREGNSYSVPLAVWLRRMKDYARLGHTLDLEENEDRIRCVAAPVRDAGGKIVGAISVSSAAQYLDDDRIDRLAEEVRRTAQAISQELGWNEDISAFPAAKARRTVR